MVISWVIGKELFQPARACQSAESESCSIFFWNFEFGCFVLSAERMVFYVGDGQSYNDSTTLSKPNLAGVQSIVQYASRNATAELNATGYIFTYCSS